MEKELIRAKKAEKVTLLGFFINALLAIFKLTAGTIGRSSAMVADAVHSLSDFLTDIAVLISFKYTSKPADKCHNYGHGKYETLVTVIISITLAFVSYQILKSGVIKILLTINGGVLPKPRLIALIAAIISIISKELLYRYTIIIGKSINSPSIIANAWHHRSDALSSIGTMIGIGGSMILGSRWAILDPIASIIVSLFILKVAFDIFIPSINELVERSLNNGIREKLENIFNDCQNVKDYHKLRTRKVGTRAVVESHILVDRKLNIIDAHNIATEVETKIKDLVGEDSIVTIHIEPYDNKEGDDT